LKIEPNASQGMIQGIVSKKMDYEYSGISIGHNRYECVDLGVTECEA